MSGDGVYGRLKFESGVHRVRGRRGAGSRLRGGGGARHAESGRPDLIVRGGAFAQVQRVPLTETQGRVHTSTASVAVLPQAREAASATAPCACGPAFVSFPDAAAAPASSHRAQATEVDVVIRDEDIRIDTYRSSGAGGQHVNTTNSAVRPEPSVYGCCAYVTQRRSEKSQHTKKRTLPCPACLFPPGARCV